MKQPILLVFILLQLLLVSCSEVVKSTKSYLRTNQANLDGMFEKHARPPKPANKQSPPAAITEALVPDFNQSLAASGLNQQGLMNISVHEIDAREFFMGLVTDTNENMLVHPEVKGRISLELKNVTVPQVLDAVQRIYGYDYKKNDIGYIIYPASLQTKTFKINHLDLMREGKSRTQVSSGQINNQNSGAQSNTGQIGGIQQAINSPSGSNPSNANENTSGSTLETKTDTDFWLELDTAIQSIIAVDKEATAVINRQSGTILVRAKPMQLREIENFLDVTEKQISRQVLLEAKILEVELDDHHQAGVNWESVVREGVKAVPLITGVGAIGAVKSEVFSLGAKAGDFRAFVELLESQGKTNILSNPRISTLNNQTAIIKVGRDEFFITRISSSTIATGTTAVSNPNVTFTQFFSGIALNVTPQINDNDEITLHIHPAITRVESQNKQFTVDDKAGEVPLALNTVRESDSIVKVLDGQIIVLGGLIQESDVENKEGVAGFSQIPILGNLFRVNVGTKQKSELVILLKATMINEQTDWKTDLNASQERLERLQSKPRWK